MNRDELEKLADYIEIRLREIGAAEIADPLHYTIVEHDTGDEFLVDPLERIVLMLDIDGPEVERAPWSAVAGHQSRRRNSVSPATRR